MCKSHNRWSCTCHASVIRDVKCVLRMCSGSYNLHQKPHTITGKWSCISIWKIVWTLIWSVLPPYTGLSSLSPHHTTTVKFWSNLRTTNVHRLHRFYKGYKLWDPRTHQFVVSTDVTFEEINFPLHTQTSIRSPPPSSTSSLPEYVKLTLPESDDEDVPPLLATLSLPKTQPAVLPQQLPLPPQHPPVRVLLEFPPLVPFIVLLSLSVSTLAY